MKLLMIYADRFWCRPNPKNLEEVDTMVLPDEFTDVQVGFVQVEQQDEEDLASKETKLVKNLKWAAKKNNTNKILLHSFAHLSDSKASAESTKLVFDNAERRLHDSGYDVAQTPFGYFLDLEIKTPGLSLARVFKDL